MTGMKKTILIAAILLATPASAQKLACPAGTYYDARKGSCHVAGPSYGAVTHY
jgi:hypothetical protein